MMPRCRQNGRVVLSGSNTKQILVKFIVRNNGYAPRTEGNEFLNLKLALPDRPDITDGVEKKKQGANKNGNPDKEHRHEFYFAMSVRVRPVRGPFGNPDADKHRQGGYKVLERVKGAAHDGLATAHKPNEDQKDRHQEINKGSDQRRILPATNTIFVIWRSYSTTWHNVHVPLFR